MLGATEVVLTGHGFRPGVTVLGESREITSTSDTLFDIQLGRIQK